jgi:DNA-binding response OmpR family regulator
MAVRILVVDDEQQAVKLISDVLTPMGYEILGLTDSRIAADQINRQKFDAVFLDFRMPHIDGFELTRRIRTSLSNSLVPIVMMTAYDDVELMRRGFQAGITFFLHKPFNPDKLRGLLSTMQSMILKERRRYARLPLKTMVAAITKGGKHLQLKSSNLSQAGMLLESSAGLEVGDEIQIEFALPEHHKAIHSRARVVRKDTAGGIALGLFGMTADDQETTLNYIAGVVKA